MQHRGSSRPTLWTTFFIALGLGLALLLSLHASALAMTPEMLGPEREAPAPSSHSPAVSDTVTFTQYLPIVARPAPPQSLYGAQFYGGLNVPNAGLPQATAAHVAWARVDLSWAQIEPTSTTPPSYDFTAYDASFAAAQAAGIRLVVTIGGNPTWAATYSNGPVDKAPLSRFTQFVEALVSHYGGTPGSIPVDYWEFYNEPDNGNALFGYRGAGYWGPFPTQYAQMLCAAYPVVKAANPKAQVALGGLALDSFEDQNGPFVRYFLDRVLAAGAGACFDAMNFHFYPTYTANWYAYGYALIGKANYVRQVLSANGVADKQMMVTESGWGSSAQGTSPEIQAAYTVRLTAEARAARVGVFIWWSWLDLTNWPAAFGLLTTDLQVKPAYRAYKTAAEKLGQALFLRPLTNEELGAPSPLEGYAFATATSAPNNLYAVWSNYPQSYTANLQAVQAEVYDMYGTPIRRVNDADDGVRDGLIHVLVGPYPVYIETIP